VNEAFRELTGYAPEEVIGKSPGLLQGPKTDPAVLDQLSDDLFNGRIFHGRTVNYPKAGEPFLMEWKIFPVPNENGEIKYYLAVQRDDSK
jgi:PAS domain S-box-containing protein